MLEAWPEIKVNSIKFETVVFTATVEVTVLTAAATAFWISMRPPITVPLAPVVRTVIIPVKYRGAAVPLLTPVSVAAMLPVRVVGPTLILSVGVAVLVPDLDVHPITR